MQSNSRHMPGAWSVVEPAAAKSRRSRESWPENYLLDDDPSAMSDMSPDHTGSLLATCIALLGLAVAGAVALSDVGSRLLAFLAR